MQLEDLIAQVRSQPALYDTREVKNADRNVVSTIWKDIATQLNTTDIECKNKWHHLRSNFMRERRKHKEECLENGNKKRRKWFYYDSMEFLAPYVNPRAKKSNVSIHMEGVAEEDLSSYPPPEEMIKCVKCSPGPSSPEVPKEITVSSYYIQDGIVTPCGAGVEAVVDHVDVNNQSSSSQNIQEKKITPKPQARNSINLDLNLLEEVKEVKEEKEEKITVDERDSDRLFLLSLLPMMKKLSPADNMDIKIEIYESFRRKLFQS